MSYPQHWTYSISTNRFDEPVEVNLKLGTGILIGSAFVYKNVGTADGLYADDFFIINFNTDDVNWKEIPGNVPMSWGQKRCTLWLRQDAVMRELGSKFFRPTKAQIHTVHILQEGVWVVYDALEYYKNKHQEGDTQSRWRQCLSAHKAKLVEEAKERERRKEKSNQEAGHVSVPAGSEARL